MQAVASIAKKLFPTRVLHLTLWWNGHESTSHVGQWASQCSNPGRVNFMFSKTSTSRNAFGYFHIVHKSKNWFCQTFAYGEWIVIDLLCEGAIWISIDFVVRFRAPVFYYLFSYYPSPCHIHSQSFGHEFNTLEHFTKILSNLHSELTYLLKNSVWRLSPKRLNCSTYRLLNVHAVGWLSDFGSIWCIKNWGAGQPFMITIQSENGSARDRTRELSLSKRAWWPLHHRVNVCRYHDCVIVRPNDVTYAKYMSQVAKTKIAVIVNLY